MKKVAATMKGRIALFGTAVAFPPGALPELFMPIPRFFVIGAIGIDGAGG
jgi:hypothetical protein